MELLREISRWSHVIFGFVGLMAFWFPVFARKGGSLHRKAGTVFVLCGYAVTASAAVSCVLIAAAVIGPGLVEQNRSTLALVVFLAYLAWVTFVTLRYSVGVLKTKKAPTELDTPVFRFLAYSVMLSSVLIIAFAVVFPSSSSVLLYALSPIGILTGLPMLKYMRGDVDSPRAWFYEHMTATFGAGIAFHTAFAVFGAQRIFAMPSAGPAAVVPWILPTLLGVPAIHFWKRYYQKKFGEWPQATPSVPQPKPVAALD